MTEAIIQPPRLNNVVYVNSISDLPTPVGGVITLENNTVYEFAPGVFVFGTNRIVCPQNCVIRGQGSSVSIIASNLAGDTFITSNTPSGILRIENLQFTFSDNTATVFDIEFLENFIIDNCFFIGECDLGRIANLNTFRCANLSSLVGFSVGLELDGTIASILFDRTGAVNIGTTPAPQFIYTNPTTEIQLLFQFAGCVFFVPSGSIGIYVDPATTFTFGEEVMILAASQFRPSPVTATFGSALGGIDESSVNLKSRLSYGQVDTIVYGEYYWTTATATTISVAGTPVKAAGTTTEIGSRGFLHSNNQLKYKFQTPIYARVDVAVKITGAALLTDVSVYIAINGTVQPSSKTRLALSTNGTYLTTFGVYELNFDDEIEVYVANESFASNITVQTESSKVTVIAL